MANIRSVSVRACAIAAVILGICLFSTHEVNASSETNGCGFSSLEKSGSLSGSCAIQALKEIGVDARMFPTLRSLLIGRDSERSWATLFNNEKSEFCAVEVSGRTTCGIAALTLEEPGSSYKVSIFRGNASAEATCRVTDNGARRVKNLQAYFISLESRADSAPQDRLSPVLIRLCSRSDDVLVASVSASSTELIARLAETQIQSKSQFLILPRTAAELPGEDISMVFHALFRLAATPGPGQWPLAASR